MDWQGIVNEVVKEAMSAKWRDFALTRLPEVSGWRLQKPKAFEEGNEAVYAGITKGGIQVKVTVNKADGVWRIEGGGVTIEDDIDGLDQKSVEFALDEATGALDQRVAERRGKRV